MHSRLAPPGDRTRDLSIPSQTLTTTPPPPSPAVGNLLLDDARQCDWRSAQMQLTDAVSTRSSLNPVMSAMRHRPTMRSPAGHNQTRHRSVGLSVFISCAPAMLRAGIAFGGVCLCVRTKSRELLIRTVVLNLGSRDPLGVPNANLEYQQISPNISNMKSIRY